MDYREDKPNHPTERYGTDELYRFLLWTCILLALLRLLFGHGLVSYIILGLILLVLSFAVFRLCSHNHPARRQENRMFLLCVERIKKGAGLFWRRIQDRHTHAYRVCPECRAVLRLKRKRGEQELVCPRCKTRFTVYIK